MSRPRKRKPTATTTSSGEGELEVVGNETEEQGDHAVSDEDVVRAVEEVADAIVAAVLEQDAGDGSDEAEGDEGEGDEGEGDEGEGDEAEGDEAEGDESTAEADEAEPLDAESREDGEAAMAAASAPASEAEPSAAPAEELGYETVPEGEDDGTLPGEDTEERPGLEKAPPLSVSSEHLKSVIESLLFVSDKPLAAHRLAKVARATTKDVQALLDVLIEDYRGRGVELVEVAGGYQFRSSAANAPFVRELVARKPVRLTRAQVETLAISAYRQPITRPEIDEIRGVDSGSALKVLLERNLLKIIGRKDEPGRPLLYGTTPAFLEFFGLASLADLPTLKEYSELSEESRSLFQRRTGESIEEIADIAVEQHEYTDEELEGLAAQAAIEEETFAAGSAGEQQELDVAPGARAEPEPSEAASDEEESDDGDDDDDDDDESPSEPTSGFEEEADEEDDEEDDDDDDDDDEDEDEDEDDD